MDGSPRLREEHVGDQWIITSPDVPGLYVAHPDLSAAYDAVPEAIAMLKAMAERRAQRDRNDDRVSACA